MPELRVVSLAPGYTERAFDKTDHTARLSPVVFLHVALALLIVSNVGRIPLFDLGDREAPLLVGDLGVGLVVMSGMLVSLAKRSLRLDSVSLAALLFAAIGGVTAMAAVPRFGLTGFELLASLAYLARWLTYFAVYVVIVNHVRSRHIDGLWSTLEGAILIFAAFGILQSVFLPDFAALVYPDQPQAWDRQGNRLVSTVLDPNMAAAMILTVLLVQLAKMASGARVAMWKPFLLLAALLFTLSRSGILSLAVGGLVILAARGVSKRMLAFGAAVVVAVLATLPQIIEFGTQYQRFGVSDGSAANRLIVWQRALSTFLDYPWFGIGFNTFAYVQEHRGFERVGSGQSYSAEGGLLFVAVMTGVVGLIVFVGMLAMVIRKCRAGWRWPRVDARQRALFVGAAAVTSALLVNSLFVNSLFHPFVMLPLWTLWGLAHIARQEQREPGAA